MNEALDLFSFSFLKPNNNISYEKFIESEYIILGHFTTSTFLKDILENGLKASKHTGYISNKVDAKDIDRDYIYLSGHFDKIFSEYAIEKYSGKKILILVKVKKDTLELDDFNNIYSNNDIDLKSSNGVYLALTQNIFSQCRSKETINPSQIIEVFDVEKVLKDDIYNKSQFNSTETLTLSKLECNMKTEKLVFSDSS